ncbi:MAG: adenylate/guanylate cyclase domain-containing protein [Armatimonadetes bacterium]|nr:adenylate/guanylate cyclase domain-containing protein [Armatimonadota bacterium]
METICQFCNQAVKEKHYKYNDGTVCCMLCFNALPQCCICKKPCKAYSLQGEKIVCPDCLQNRPKCNLCGKVILGAHYKYQKGLSVCEVCYAQWEKCINCRIPLTVYFQTSRGKLCQECYDKMRNCSICNNKILDPFFQVQDHRTGSVYCQECCTKRPRCSLCGYPTGKSSHSLPDGRQICAVCAQRSAVEKAQEEEALPQAGPGLFGRMAAFLGSRKKAKEDTSKKEGPEQRTVHKEYTFLSLDLVDSTKIKQGERKERIITTFKHYHDYVKNITESNSGEILGTSGDGIACIFEVADDAVSTAFLVQKGLAEFNRELNELGSPLQIRMGINTGEILLEFEGDEQKTGDIFDLAVDLAAKAQKFARVNEICVTNHAYAKLSQNKSRFVRDKYVNEYNITLFKQNFPPPP